jgi:hypothetical protein
MLTPVTTGLPNVFVKLDKATVVGILKSGGSRDPDVLHAQKEALLSPVRSFKVWALILMVAGGLMTLTVIGAIVGVPSLLFGWFVWHRRAHNIAAVEAGFAEYLASAAPAGAGAARA